MMSVSNKLIHIINTQNSPNTINNIMNAKDLINWRKLSEHLTGNPTYIRKNFVPKKYQDFVNSIIKSIAIELNKK